MAQVLEFKLPDLGEGLTEAEIVRWLVAVGDVVAVDQPVVEVETAKAMVEVPCPYGGVVTARFGEEGSDLPVGAPLLTVAVGASDPAEVPLSAVGPPGRSGPSDQSPPGPSGASGPSGSSRSGPGAGDLGRTAGPGPDPAGSGPSAATRTSPPTGPGAAPGRGPAGGGRSGNVLVGYGTGAPTGRRRRVRRPAPAASGGRVEQANGAAQGPVPVVSPLVRRLARERGVDLRALTGTGRDGLIMRSDVERAALRTEVAEAPTAGSVSAGPVSAPSVSAGPAPAESVSVEAARAESFRPVAGAAARAGVVRVPLRGVAGAAAEKFTRSRREIPDATCWVDADATELMAVRTAMNAAGGPKISILALLARICTAALARHPELNATVDQAAREIVRLPEVHLGFAAQTDRGLVVPVVRDAHARSVESLSAEIARLTEAARVGRMAPGDLVGGTFTLNNYGVFGVDGSTPIINHPEAAMLGVGRIVPKPWVHDGELAVRQVVQLSLTFDHRVCDGGTAGGFLRHVADCVEQPAVLLRSL
ncbi:dihydrolipoamide acetyltransferase family protein [Streptomyces sp. NPDC095613]|uniref:dihydrolipoamide acetyltransferase family protein n=1 Tax=Streptomyces sp. NPDC095613 TaxID=3155540 RepID=UPI00331A9421